MKNITERALASHGGSGPVFLLLQRAPWHFSYLARGSPAIGNVRTNGGLRMALDNPENVSRVALLDCLPIGEHLDCADVHFATAWWHWFFFAQPDLPERVIVAAPDARYRGDAKTMGQENYSEWRAAMHDLSRAGGMLEEYQASLWIDVRDERSDRAADRALQQPLLALRSTGDDVEDLYGDPLVIWRDWATDVTGHGIDLCLHTAELAPGDLAAALVSFFAET